MEPLTHKVNEMKQWAEVTDIEKGWLAGFFSGRGNVALPRTSVSSVDREALDAVQELLGGEIVRRVKHYALTQTYIDGPSKGRTTATAKSPFTFEWRVDYEEAITALSRLLECPLLDSQRDRIEALFVTEESE